MVTLRLNTKVRIELTTHGIKVLQYKYGLTHIEEFVESKTYYKTTLEKIMSVFGTEFSGICSFPPFEDELLINDSNLMATLRLDTEVRIKLTSNGHKLLLNKCEPTHIEKFVQPKIQDGYYKTTLREIMSVFGTEFSGIFEDELLINDSDLKEKNP